MNTNRSTKNVSQSKGSEFRNAWMIIFNDLTLDIVLKGLNILRALREFKLIPSLENT